MLKIKKIILFIPFANFALWFMWLIFYYKNKIDKSYKQSERFLIRNLFLRLVSILVLMWLVIGLLVAVPIIIMFKLGAINNDLGIWRLILIYLIGIAMGIVFIWDEVLITKEIEKIKKSQTLMK